jgi:arylsulfatase A-like enzyme
MHWGRSLATVAVAIAWAGTGVAAAQPDVLLVTIDTLRSDHLGAYGYDRHTSPHIDGFLAQGARFTEARTVEPLTAPALTSMITGLEPHEHAATRNGLRMRSDLVSFPIIFKRRGYDTAAIIGNWTLRDKLTGLGEHFAEYLEILTKPRWFGFLKGEATAEDLTDAALEWLDARGDAPRKPFVLWVHYVEPHAPYELQRDFVDQVGPGSPNDRVYRYDTEIAFVDHHVGRLLDGVARHAGPRGLITALVGDHGESLGEHEYWGHGRHLYDVTLRIPMGIAWAGHIPPATTVDGPAMITDVATTLLSLAGLPVPDFYVGYDWSPQLLDGAAAPSGRVTLHQAHRGAVQRRDAPQRVRQQGLLEVARVADGRKEVWRLTNDRRWAFDLDADPGETRSIVLPDSPPSAELTTWLTAVREGLVRSDDLPPPALDDADLEALRDLGYVD